MVTRRRLRVPRPVLNVLVFVGMLALAVGIYAAGRVVAVVLSR